MKKVYWIATAALLFVTPCFSQSDDKRQPDQYYRLDFVLKELEGGRVINSRTYTTLTHRSPGDLIQAVSTIKVGDKVPVPTDKGQWTFIDVGVNIDTKAVMPMGNELSMYVSADISSVSQTGSSGGPPLIRQTRWNSTVIFPLRKPTTIFSSDGVSDKRQTQLEVTATPIP